MKHGEDKRAELRRLYVSGLPLRQAAKAVGISMRTASRWRDEALGMGFDWDQARAAARLSAQGLDAINAQIMEDFVVLFQSTIDSLKAEEGVSALQKAEAISRLSDAYHKTTAAIAKNTPKLNEFAVAMGVLQKLAEFVSAHYPQHAPAFAEIMEPFGESLARV